MALTWEILLFALSGGPTHFTDLRIGALSDWTDPSRVYAEKPLQGEHCDKKKDLRY